MNIPLKNIRYLPRYLLKIHKTEQSIKPKGYTFNQFKRFSPFFVLLYFFWLFQVYLINVIKAR